MNFFAMPYLVLLPFYVEDVLGVAADWYGYILAAYGAGSLVGYALYGSLRMSGAARARVLVLCLVVLSACLGALGIARHPWMSMALIGCAGLAGGIFNVATITLIQMDTADEMRGRMFGLLHTMVGGLAPVSMGLTGVVTDLIDQNVPAVFMACGVALISVSIIMSFSRSFKVFLSAEPGGE
jgi:MFS family permease